MIPREPASAISLRQLIAMCPQGRAFYSWRQHAHFTRTPGRAEKSNGGVPPI